MTGGRAPKRKGDAWERLVRDYARARGYACDRAYGAGRPDDVGDLFLDCGAPVLLIDCKATARSERAVWMTALRARSGVTDYGAIPVIVERRRGMPVENAFVTLDLYGFLDLLRFVTGGSLHGRTNETRNRGRGDSRVDSVRDRVDPDSRE